MHWLLNTLFHFFKLYIHFSLLFVFQNIVLKCNIHIVNINVCVELVYIFMYMDSVHVQVSNL